MTGMILIGAIVLGTVLMQAPWFVQARSNQLERVARLGFIGLAALTVIILTASGRFSAALIAIIALLPFSSIAHILWQATPAILLKDGSVDSETVVQGDMHTSMGEMKMQKNQSIDFSPLNREQAFQILGLNEDAAPDEIMAAHQLLIQKLHTDGGGSHYLAAQVDAAKEVLCGEIILKEQ